jgi:N-acetyl-gamma-glutamyl-phosphate reductase
VPSAIVAGASGYAGALAAALLHRHPRFDLVAVTSRSDVGTVLGDLYPYHRVPLELEELDVDRHGQVDTAIVAYPHGASAPVVAALRERGVRVVDLSADFRLRDPDQYASWYGSPEHPHHPAPELLKEAVYGLVELYRAKLAGARVVAVPGCYPTASILALAPLLEAGLVSPEGLIVDAKSGVSGAGRGTSLGTHFSEIGEGIRPYKVAGAHRHTVEIEQELSALAGGREVRLVFTPHLVPMTRGIVTCVYATPTDATRPAAAYQDALAKRWAGEPFVTVLPPGQLPDTSFVRGSNRIHVGVAYDARARRVLAMSAIDNLVKGAYGQAIQCMNLVLGFPETTGLQAPGIFP